MELHEIYKALGDESRLRIVHILSKGNFNVQELTSIINSSQPTVSHHLKVLQSIGIVKSRKEGTWAYYTLSSLEEQPVVAEIARGFLATVEKGSLNGSGELFREDLSSLSSIFDGRRARSQKFFEEVAPQWRQLRAKAATAGVVDDSYLSVVAERIPSSTTLLDVGCGTGALLERVLPRKGKTIGVDNSPAMLAEASRSLGDKASGADFRLGSLEHLPVANATIDFAVACMVLHHSADPVEALNDLARTLKTEGSLLVVDLTPHHDERMREQFSHLWLGFDPKEFRKWLVGAGFETKKVSLFGARNEIFLIEAVLTNRKEKL